MTDNQAMVKTLAEQVRWQLSWLGIGLFFACLLLVLVVALRATDSTTESLMRLEAQSLLRQAKDHPELPLPQGDALSAYRHWNEIPAQLQSHFGNSPPVSGKTMEVVVKTGQGVAEYYYLLHHADSAENSVYLISRHDEAEVDAIFGSFFRTAFIQALWLTSIIFVSLFLLIRWLIRRTTEPLSLLSQWATDLGNNPEQSLDVTFPIEELNRLAAQLRMGVEQTRAHNERERSFLQHASHELRTPLAIIQASLDTLDLQNHPSSQPAVQRALRASANMRQLSATLLWLARETGQPVDKTRFDLHPFCKKIIDDHRYLVSNRAISIQTDISPESVEVERDLLAIVIANLVRNAFQYSSEGALFITVSACEICITNPTDSAEHSGEHDVRDSYGLGLQLVKRICRKMNWHFAFEESAERVSAIVRWCD